MVVQSRLEDKSCQSQTEYEYCPSQHQNGKAFLIGQDDFVDSLQGCWALILAYRGKCSQLGDRSGGGFTFRSPLILFLICWSISDESVENFMLGSTVAKFHPCSVVQLTLIIKRNSGSQFRDALGNSFDRKLTRIIVHFVESFVARFSMQSQEHWLRTWHKKLFKIEFPEVQVKILENF